MIDAHFHCWQPDRGDYGWLTPEMGSICRDVSVADWSAQAQPCGIQAGVLVQAAPTEAETHFLLAQADLHQEVMGVVGWVDMLAPDAAGRIEKLAQHPRLKGLRPMLQDLDDPDWILQASVAPALRAMASCGLVLDALIRPVHLQRIRVLLTQHPDLRVVIDHGAKPSPREPIETWVQGLSDIARSTSADRVACKLSGLWTELPHGQGCGALAPWCEALLAVWGAERLIWGSDWPVLELAGDYARWRAWSVDFLNQRCTPQQVMQILDGNARRMYRL